MNKTDPLNSILKTKLVNHMYLHFNCLNKIYLRAQFYIGADRLFQVSILPQANNASAVQTSRLFSNFSNEECESSPR